MEFNLIRFRVSQNPFKYYEFILSNSNFKKLIKMNLFMDNIIIISQDIVSLFVKLEEFKIIFIMLRIRGLYFFDIKFILSSEKESSCFEGLII